MRKEVIELFNSDLSDYKISKDTGVPYSTVNDLRKGKTSIDKAKFLTIEKLAKYWENAKKGQS